MMWWRRFVQWFRDIIHEANDGREFEKSDPDGSIQKVTLRTRKNGTHVWKAANHGTHSPGCSAVFGERRENYDFNF